MNDLYSRGFHLVSILDKKHGETELILKVLELEHKLARARKELKKHTEIIELDSFNKDPAYGKISKNGSIEIEEPKNLGDEGELVLLLRLATGLDILCILGVVPKTLGLHRVTIAYRQGVGVIVRRGIVNVWILERPMRPDSDMESETMA